MSDHASQPHASQAAVARVHGSKSGRLFYFAVRALVRQILVRWLRLRVRGAERLKIDGPVILAPVHRSNLDAPLVAAVARRRIRALGKESLFASRAGAWVNSALGAIPVSRGHADRQAMRAAREVIASGEMMIVFPEGMRGSGPQIEGLFDGTVYLAAKTGAPIVPIGIAGTELAMGSGAKRIGRVRCAMVIGEPIPAGRARLSRPELADLSKRMASQLQAVFDEARQLAAG